MTRRGIGFDPAMGYIARGVDGECNLAAGSAAVVGARRDANRCLAIDCLASLILGIAASVGACLKMNGAVSAGADVHPRTSTQPGCQQERDRQDDGSVSL